MSENNEQVRWGNVTVIPVVEVPPQTAGKYLGLFQDASLRLEYTRPTEALRYSFDDAKTLQGAHSALKKMFRGQNVAVIKRAGALFIYNTVAPVKRNPGGRPRKSPSIAEMGNGHGNGNGRRLDLPDVSQLMDKDVDNFAK